MDDAKRLIEDVELRRKGEEWLKQNTETMNLSVTEVEPLRLQLDLQVHQIELEMQNAELRLSRNNLEKAMEEYTELYDFAPVGYLTLDCEGTIRRVNLTGAGFIGVVRSSLLGRSFRLIVTNKTRPTFSTFLEKVFTSPTKEACELTLMKEGNVPLCVQVEGVATASGQECQIALIDISERKRAEEALYLEKEVAEAHRLAEQVAKLLRQEKEAAEVLLLEKKLAEATSRAKNQFLVNMSHELRTPMTGILGMLQLTLLEDLAPVPREYLETTLSSAHSLLRILNDILDIAKFEAGKLIFEDNPFSLQRCIVQAVDIVTVEAHLKGLTCTYTVAEEVPEMVVGDQMRVRQVLINLIGNAVKFTDNGKVEVCVTQSTTTSEGKREFTFSVTDTGIGIPDDRKELLFRSFSQVDPSLNRKYGGTGLGLAISRDIVELMGGTISFISEEGIGSTFSFTIPLGEAALENYTLPASELSESITATQNGEKVLRILLAEDDSVTRRVITLMLKRSNYNVDVAEDGQKVIEMWEKGEYDLVLMDVQMPRLNGFEVTHFIRKKEQERGCHTPIIAMTAHAGKEYEELCLAAMMDAYITKPIDFKKCLQVIGGIIRQTATP